MKVDKDVLETLVVCLENALRDLEKDVHFHINKIREAGTVEDIMHLKKQLLVDWLRDIPLGADECYFCILYEDDCERCIYAKYHGACAESSRADLYIELTKLVDKYSGSMDDWSIINAFKDALIMAIQKKYYKGEEYEVDKPDST